MAAKFVDYYQSLGVKRDASPEDIQRAYRALVRQYHPDVNKEPGAEARFKEIQEAYEVLKDPARRKRYDELGADYKPGQEFRPPPGSAWAGSGQGRRGGFRVNFGGEGAEGVDFGSSGFSEFFESLFGGMAGGPGGAGGSSFDPFGAGAGHGRRAGRNGSRRRAGPHRGPDAEAELTITIAEAIQRAIRRVSLSRDDGGGTKTIDVRIPAGVTDGAVIRLAGQGGPGVSGGEPGDLLLRIRLAHDARFRVDPSDPCTLHTTLPVAPWEAALGAKVTAHTPDADVLVTIPPGTSSGQKLRIRGHGLPNKQGERADLIAEVRISVPKALTPEQRALWEQLAAASNFDPRLA